MRTIRFAGIPRFGSYEIRYVVHSLFWWINPFRGRIIRAGLVRLACVARFAGIAAFQIACVQRIDCFWWIPPSVFAKMTILFIFETVPNFSFGTKRLSLFQTIFLIPSTSQFDHRRCRTEIKPKL